MKKTSFTKNQQGLNLIELLLVLAIVVAIAVAAFVIYPRVQASRSASSNSQILSSALAQVQSVFQNGQYQNLDNEVAYAADVFPDTFKLTSPDLMNEFGDGTTGNVDVYGSTAAGVANTTNAARYVTIEYGDVPSAVCMKMVPGIAANFGRIAIGTAADIVVDKFDAVTTNDLLDEGTMAAQCNSAASVTVFATAR